MTATLDAAPSEPKIVVLVRLLNAIDEGNHSFEGLKARIAEGGKRPSTRSLRRYLSILTEAGFPLHFDRATNTYRFAHGYSLKRLDLSNGELFGLVALRSLGASIGGTIGASIDEVTDKLVGTAGRTVRAHVDSISPVAFRLSEIHLDAQGERAFARLSSAERSSRSVRFMYRDKDGNRSTRTIDPYGFVIHAGRIYCVGFDHDRQDKRTFAIDNVSDPDVLGNTFVKPSGFRIEEYTAGSISGVLHGGSIVSVTVAFAPRVAKAAIAARVVEERRIDHRSDGSVRITYGVTDTDELVRWVLGWGAQAEIVAPPEARSRIATLSQEIAEKYSAVSSHNM
jgi:predicted DNA-binding transcriptional regulator YafY